MPSSYIHSPKQKQSIVLPADAMFKVRVYAILIQDGCLLMSEEWYRGTAFQKLPGGGMEYFEGPEDTLRRELVEELGIDASVEAIFHVHPYSVVSAFRADHHLVMLYYRISLATPFNAEAWAIDPRFDAQRAENQQRLYWLPLSAVTETSFSMATEKTLVPLLRLLA